MSQLNAASIISYSNFIRLGYPERIVMTELKAIYGNSFTQLDLRSFCEKLLFSMKIEQSDFKFGSNCIFFRSKQAEMIKIILKPDQETITSVVEKMKRYITTRHKVMDQRCCMG